MEQRQGMTRVDRILQDPDWKIYLEKISVHERARVFCHHDLTHFLDVARLAWIFNLEEDLKIEKEEIYASALLHDIGRFVQYEDGTKHPKASADLAPEILKRCGFTQEEMERILEAIRQHGNAKIREEKNLCGILYRADKASRPCFFCAAEQECDWSSRKKNLNLEY